MKLHLITNDLGDVIATVKAGKTPLGVELRIVPVVENHHLFEAVEVPDAWGQLVPHVLHERLKRHLATSFSLKNPGDKIQERHGIDEAFGERRG
jgi:hypothetical protein